MILLADREGPDQTARFCKVKSLSGNEKCDDDDDDVDTDDDADRQHDPYVSAMLRRRHNKAAKLFITVFRVRLYIPFAS